MNPKIASLLGLCYRARRLTAGEFACENEIKKGRVKLILIAEDASNNTLKKFTNSASYNKIEFRIVGTKESLGKAIGKEERAVAVVSDEGFYKKLIELLENDN